MGYVTKSVTESVGDVSETTSYTFELFDDFLRWEREQVPDQEQKVDSKVSRQYRVIGNEMSHEFEIGEIVDVTLVKEDGVMLASNGVKEWWMIEEELEEI